MAYKHVNKLLHGAKFIRSNRSGAMHVNVVLYHCSDECRENVLPFEWYEKAFPKIMKLAYSLKNLDLIDGKLVNIDDFSTIHDDSIQHKMHTFKSFVRAFLGSPSIQEALKKNVEATSAAGKCRPIVCFSKQSEREPMTVNSLTKVCNFLNISSQQRKVVRFTICPQVTQHRIWTGALEELLNGLKSELDSLNYSAPGTGINMGQQIVSSSLKFLADTTNSDPDTSSWMRLAPKKVGESPISRKWEDILEMFNDLIQCLRGEKGLQFHVAKLEVMKEGLSQIKDVLVDKNIAYKEVRHQESLVPKKLSKTLGHSSMCLFTLLLYYLYGTVRDIEVDICGGIYKSGSVDSFCICMGRILTSDEEKMVWNGVKQLDRALALFKFVWETAGMKEVLELQGHLWCAGAKDRTLTYKGNVFFIHGINF